MSDGGKGSGRRPTAVSDDCLMQNWSNIFGPSLLERKRREEALQELVRINEELGLYDELELQQTKKSAARATGSDSVR